MVGLLARTNRPTNSQPKPQSKTHRRSCVRRGCWRLNLVTPHGVRKILRAQGVLVGRQGKGVFVAATE
jgi:hypothetical protein